MERLAAFLPTIVIMAVASGVALLYVRSVIKDFGDNLKDHTWRNENEWKVIKTIDLPIFLFLPVINTLIFRAPLVVMFDKVTTYAWLGIVASSILLLGWKEYTRRINRRVRPEDDSAKQKRNEKIEKVADVIIETLFVFPVAVVTGYYSVVYQSIWISHGLAIVVPLVYILSLGAIAIVIGILVIFGFILWEAVNRDQTEPKQPV